MLKKPKRGLFITGNNTEVGKTYVAALIARQMKAQRIRVGVYKPVASGCTGDGDVLFSEDADQLWQAAGKPLTLADVCPQRFRAPAAPHVAAHAEGKEVNADQLVHGISVWADACDFLIVEGVGGLMSPVAPDDYAADLAWEFGYPLIVVAANELGVINQTLQTLITAETFRDGLPVAGVVLNHPHQGSDASSLTNKAELENRCIPPVLTEVEYGQKSFHDEINWWSLGEG